MPGLVSHVVPLRVDRKVFGAAHDHLNQLITKPESAQHQRGVEPSLEIISSIKQAALASTHLG